MDKIKDIAVLLFAGGDGGPNAFAPAHTGLAASPLGNTAIDNRMTNLAFGAIVGWLDIRLGQKTEAIFHGFALESSGQFFGQGMIRWAAHPAQKLMLDFCHPTGKAFGGIVIAAMQGFKQLLKPFEQLFSPASKCFRAVFGQEAYTSRIKWAIQY